MCTAVVAGPVLRALQVSGSYSGPVATFELGDERREVGVYSSGDGPRFARPSVRKGYGSVIQGIYRETKGVQLVCTATTAVSPVLCGLGVSGRDVVELFRGRRYVITRRRKACDWCLQQ